MEHSTGQIGDRVRARRKRTGLTAAELARRTGVTENAIRKLEAGAIEEPRLSTGIRIAEALGISPLFLVQGRSSGRIDAGTPDLATAICGIRRCRRALEQKGVKHVRVFGSVARGEAEPESDIDVVVEPHAARRFSLFDLAAVCELLQREFEHRIDVITDGTLRHARFAREADEESVSAF